jgi:hypothetical protein
MGSVLQAQSIHQIVEKECGIGVEIEQWPHFHAVVLELLPPQSGASRQVV